jgi:hypothetical protein
LRPRGATASRPLLSCRLVHRVALARIDRPERSTRTIGCGQAPASSARRAALIHDLLRGSQSVGHPTLGSEVTEAPRNPCRTPASVGIPYGVGECPCTLPPDTLRCRCRPFTTTRWTEGLDIQARLWCGEREINIVSLTQHPIKRCRTTMSDGLRATRWVVATHRAVPLA